MRPDGERPTVEFVEDVINPELLPTLTGERLDRLGAFDLMAVAVGAPDKSLLADLANIASNKAWAAFDKSDIDLFEQWNRAASTIGDLFESSVCATDDNPPLILATITARTPWGEPVL